MPRTEHQVEHFGRMDDDDWKGVASGCNVKLGVSSLPAGSLMILALARRVETDGLSSLTRSAAPIAEGQTASFPAGD